MCFLQPHCADHLSDGTLSLFGTCESVSLPAPSVSATPVPESLSTSPVPSETGQHSPRSLESVRKERQGLKTWTNWESTSFWIQFSHYLVSEHERDYFQDMQTPLLLTLGRCQKCDQVIKAAHVNCPQQSIMDAGIIIHFLQSKMVNKTRQNVNGMLSLTKLCLFTIAY